MKSAKLTLIIVLILSLTLAACGTTPAEEAVPEEAPLFYYVSPNPIGVNEFLKMGVTGLDLVGEKYNAETYVLESEFGDPTSWEENVRAAVNDGATIVMVLGFEFNDIIAEVAPEAPDVQFLIVDQCIDNPPANVSCAVFREYEGSYLLGAVAGSLTESNKIGVIGAMDIPFLHRYTDAYAEGALAVNPDVEVSTLWVGGDNPFADPVRAKEQALALASDGADHIYAATAGGNFGVFEAAEEQGFYAYGVDVNQCPNAPGFVMENMIKRVDLAIVDAVDQIMAGETGFFNTYGVAEGAMGLVSLVGENPENSQCVIMEHPDLIETVRGIQQQIIDGTLVIADPMFAE
ncbi:MAG: BMP family ABC transporter substrate-binding protein [Anaerolineales bacterium]|nr:BMP family ABC transporter substrate-binding protein [Anaerolineales bacterium]